MSTTTAQDRTPPQDVTAEQCVIGGMLLSKDALAAVTEIIDERAFYRPAHATIFRVIAALAARNEPADPVTVIANLAAAGDLTRVGGADYVHDCVTAVPTAANAAYYARIVKDRHQLRRLIEAGTHVVQLGYSALPADLDVPDLVDRAQQAMYDLTAGDRADGLTAFGGLLQPTIDEIEALGRRGAGLRGVPTGFADLDRLLAGLQPGQLVIMAARPAVGKSTLALDVSRCASIKHGLTTAFFSMEMSLIELMMRVLSAEARVPLHQIRAGDLNDLDWIKIARRIGEISEAPLFMDETASQSLMQIRAKCRRIQTERRRQGSDLHLIVVDYLQLMETPGGGESRQNDVSALSRGLKILGKEMGTPVIAVSQLNRNPETRTDKRPVLADLRDSGAIEQDADVVILLHRDDYYDKESPRAGEADLIVAKHRNGPTDTITVAAQLHLSRFVDMAIV